MRKSVIIGAVLAVSVAVWIVLYLRSTDNIEETAEAPAAPSAAPADAGLNQNGAAGAGTGQIGGGTAAPPGPNQVLAPGLPPPGPGGGATAPTSTQVKLSGTITLPKDAPPGDIQIDVNGPAAGGPVAVSPGNANPGPGGTNAAGPLASMRLKKAGPFTLMVPRKAGQVQLSIFLGVVSSDPGKVGPANIYSWGPLEVGTDDITDIKLDLGDPAVQAGALPSAPSSPQVPGHNAMPPAGAPPLANAPAGAPNPSGQGQPGVAPPVAPPPGIFPGTAPASPGGASSGVPMAPGVYAPGSSPAAPRNQ